MIYENGHKTMKNGEGCYALSKEEITELKRILNEQNNLQSLINLNDKRLLKLIL